MFEKVLRITGWASLLLPLMLTFECRDRHCLKKVDFRGAFMRGVVSGLNRRIIRAG